MKHILGRTTGKQNWRQFTALVISFSTGLLVACQKKNESQVAVPPCFQADAQLGTPTVEARESKSCLNVGDSYYVLSKNKDLKLGLYGPEKIEIVRHDHELGPMAVFSSSAREASQEKLEFPVVQLGVDLGVGQGGGRQLVPQLGLFEEAHQENEKPLTYWISKENPFFAQKLEPQAVGKILGTAADVIWKRHLFSDSGETLVLHQMSAAEVLDPADRKLRVAALRTNQDPELRIFLADPYIFAIQDWVLLGEERGLWVVSPANKLDLYLVRKGSFQQDSNLTEAMRSSAWHSVRVAWHLAEKPSSSIQEPEWGGDLPQLATPSTARGADREALRVEENRPSLASSGSSPHPPLQESELSREDKQLWSETPPRPSQASKSPRGTAPRKAPPLAAKLPTLESSSTAELPQVNRSQVDKSMPEKSAAGRPANDASMLGATRAKGSTPPAKSEEKSKLPVAEGSQLSKTPELVQPKLVQPTLKQNPKSAELRSEANAPISKPPEVKSNEVKSPEKTISVMRPPEAKNPDKSSTTKPNVLDKKANLISAPSPELESSVSARVQAPAATAPAPAPAPAAPKAPSAAVTASVAPKKTLSVNDIQLVADSGDQSWKNKAQEALNKSRKNLEPVLQMLPQIANSKNLTGESITFKMSQETSPSGHKQVLFTWKIGNKPSRQIMSIQINSEDSSNAPQRLLQDSTNINRMKNMLRFSIGNN